MIAVIKAGGKQYLVQEGDVFTTETIAKNPGESISFETLMINDGDKLKMGMPILGMNVTGEVVAHGRAKKVDVVKYKAKSRYTRRVGHRQNFTKIKITKIA